MSVGLDEDIEESAPRKIPEDAIEFTPIAETAEVDTKQATKELAYLSSGSPARDLKREAIEKEHDRNQKFRDCFEDIALLALKGLSITLALVGAVWVWHMIMPSQINFFWGGVLHTRWLTEAQLSKVQGFLTGGVLIGSLGKHIERRTAAQ